MPWGGAAERLGVDGTRERAALTNSGPWLPQARAFWDSTWRVTSLFLSVMLDLGGLTLIRQQMWREGFPLYSRECLAGTHAAYLILTRRGRGGLAGHWRGQGGVFQHHVINRMVVGDQKGH